MDKFLRFKKMKKKFIVFVLLVSLLIFSGCSTPEMEIYKFAKINNLPYTGLTVAYPADISNIDIEEYE